MNRRPIVLLTGLTIIVATFALITYWPALSARALSFDDTEYLTANHLIQNPGFTSAYRFLTEVLKPSTVSGYYQPLSMISLMLDYAGGGRIDNLQPFHRTSLLLHICNTILVIVLIYSLFNQPWIAAMLGLLFAVHPLTVETIPWISERKTLLTTFFALWCLLLYVQHARKGGWRYYTAALVLLLPALMSKPTSTPLPALLLLLDCWPLKKINSRIILEKIPFFVITAIFAIITLISQGQTAELTMHRGLSRLAMPLIICHNVFFYPYKMLWPATLSSVYPFPNPLSLANPIILAAMIGTLALVPALIISLRWTRAFCISWLIFFTALLPTLMVSGYSLGVAADKYVYLPSIGILLFLAWLFSRFWSPAINFGTPLARRVSLLAMVLILVAAEVRTTRRQLTYWQDSVTLYRHMSTVAPDSAPIRNGLGLALSESGQVTEAIVQLDQALQIDNRYNHAHYNLANALVKLNRFDEAFEHYSMTVQVDPKYYKAYNNMGSILLTRGQDDEALKLISEALRLHPDYPEAHVNMGIALARRGDIDKAIENYNQALRLDPDNFNAHCNLANALLGQDKIDEAIQHYKRALQIKPGHAVAHTKLMEAIAKKKE